MTARADSLTEQDIAALVRRFYRAAREDPLLAPVFEAAVKDWEAHFDLVASFWSSSLLGVRAYRGDPLAEHRKHPLTPAMFERWLVIWGETADAMFQPEIAGLLKARAAMIAQSLQLGVFGLPSLKAP